VISVAEANTILRAVARYGVAEHLMARELYAPSAETHGAAQRCETALAEVHTIVRGLVVMSSLWTDDTSGEAATSDLADIDPAITAIDAAIVEMNTYTANLLAKLRELGVDTETIPRRHHAFSPPPSPPPIGDDFSYLNEYGQRRT
jgi:hypothetical protein